MDTGVNPRKTNPLQRNCVRLTPTDSSGTPLQLLLAEGHHDIPHAAESPTAMGEEQWIQAKDVNAVDAGLP